MCKPFEIARTTAMNFILNRRFFLYKELRDKIIESGGIFRVSSSHTLDQYLDYYERIGMIKYLPIKKGYEIFA